MTNKILCVVGARPNFMKIAPVVRALKKAGITPFLLHTGQHYDDAMNHTFFQQLGIPTPDVNLAIGSGSHAVQTAEIMKAFEPVLVSDNYKAVLVVGDVNSTIACSLVAAKLHVPVIHVEAGLRSNDRQMPEEINRVLTDRLSDLLFTTEPAGECNLLNEGVDPDRIHYVGNVMIDTLLSNVSQAPELSDVFDRHQITADFGKGEYAVLTMHRPSNVDDPKILHGLIDSIQKVAESLPLIFAVHPRTKASLERNQLFDVLAADQNIHLLPPLEYLDLLTLMRHAKMVLTDSGGLQEETTALGVPCITLRENTERPVTVDEGTNTIVGTSDELIQKTVQNIVKSGGKSGCVPKYWDGKAAERIAAVIKGWMN